MKPKQYINYEKSGTAENKSPKSESSSMDTQSGQGPTPTGAGFSASPFDFSAMTGLLNDPSIKELAEQIAQDPSFNQMAEQLQKTFHGAPAEDGIPQFDSQQYYSTMQQVMQNPQFMTMAERLGNALMQDPSMSTVLENLANPSHKDQLDERMALIKEDPALKPILEEIETEGPAAMMRILNRVVVDVIETKGHASDIQPPWADPLQATGAEQNINRRESEREKKKKKKKKQIEEGDGDGEGGVEKIEGESDREQIARREQIEGPGDVEGRHRDSYDPILD
ncbi:hypothetical protein HYC85_017320 [Camellia sinensis]|uniref:STI1 domain-containing protein n=1 Tax=Camellia sinensis TaxID=4442 RepID=A0A7J7H2A4_CAMSI|nr:hypothetical protein HYC85_017320 [Camellia sinensis]